MNTKIICCYHRQAPKIIYETPRKYPEIFVPLLGGACYYQRGSDPFFDVCAKDDVGTNISYLDVHFSEHTQLYWAYKHLKELGNPDMIGLCHYRRFMDVDYNNLDITKIYLRRDPSIRVASAWFSALRWVGVPITQMVIDEFLYQMPEYKDAIESIHTCYKFFDKNMFIMSKPYFLAYMEYLQKWYRICLDHQLWQNVKEWETEHHEARLAYFIVKRGVAFLLELASAIYFEHLYINNYPIIIAKPTEDSFNDY